MEAVGNALLHRIETILKEDPEAINRSFEMYPIFPLYAEGWFTPLVFAINLNKPDVVKWLLKQGADASIHSPEGKSLVEIARSKEFGPIAELLQNHLP
jgi:hypothetical protein